MDLTNNLQQLMAIEERAIAESSARLRKTDQGWMYVCHRDGKMVEMPCSVYLHGGLKAAWSVRASSFDLELTRYKPVGVGGFDQMEHFATIQVLPSGAIMRITVVNDQGRMAEVREFEFPKGHEAQRFIQIWDRVPGDLTGFGRRAVTIAAEEEKK